jgi:hypothetical protein
MTSLPTWTPGLDIVTTAGLRDGKVVVIGSKLFLGTAPLTVKEQAGRDARMIVREGLADVLEWLGQSVYTEPTTAEILAELRGHRIAHNATEILRRSGY